MPWKVEISGLFPSRHTARLIMIINKSRLCSAYKIINFWHLNWARTRQLNCIRASSAAKNTQQYKITLSWHASEASLSHRTWHSLRQQQLTFHSCYCAIDVESELKRIRLEWDFPFFLITAVTERQKREVGYMEGGRPMLLLCVSHFFEKRNFDENIKNLYLYREAYQPSRAITRRKQRTKLTVNSNKMGLLVPPLPSLINQRRNYSMGSFLASEYKCLHE